MRILFFLLFISTAYAQDLRSTIEANLNPIRQINQVHKKSLKEEVYRLTNSKVMIADYELIRKDFPDIAHYSNDQIDFWLYKHTAFISIPQAEQNIVNSLIPVNKAEKITAYRPPEYGRALVFNVTNSKGADFGLIDIKGSGSISPSQKSHGNGLASLGESLREFSYEKMVSSVVAHSGIDNKVVGSYAVIDAGFDIVHSDGSKSRAGLYLRQAHKRYTSADTGRGNGWLDKAVRNRFENLLTKYGIYANENIQGTVDNHLFDFGHFVVKDEVIKDNIRVNVDTKYSVPFDIWGYNKSNKGDGSRWEFSKLDNPWIWSHETSEAFAKGNISRHDVWLHHYNLIKPVQEKLSEVERPIEFSKKLGFKMSNSCSTLFKNTSHAFGR